MNKQLFLVFIEKYSLGNSVESVAWESTNNVLKSRFISDDKSLLGDVSINGFDSKEFGAHKLGIFKTSTFVKLLKILGDEVEVSLQVVGEKPTAIKMSDENNIKLHFALSDLAVIPSVPSLKHVPKDFEVSINITKELANIFTTTKSAMPEVTSFTVHVAGKDTQIILGQTDVNTNNVTIPVESTVTSSIPDVSFNAELFKQIILSNKGVDAQFKISKEGLSVIEYHTEAYTAKYYLVARATE